MPPSVSWYPDLAARVLSALRVQIQPALDEFLAGVGQWAGMDVTFVQLAAALEPDPLTPEVLIRRTPYACPEAMIENLLACAGRGWLTQTMGKFRLTEAGRLFAQELVELGDRLFAQIEALPALEMKRLLTLLNQVVETVKCLPASIQKPAFSLNLRLSRGFPAPLLVQIRRRLIDLLAFREDAYVAAWASFETEGQIWETFTLVWRQQARSAAELAEQLPYRYYAEIDYAAALEKLAARGWIIRLDGGFQATPNAAQMRQQVEDLTDDLFAAAFGALEAAELAELQGLLVKLLQTIQSVVNPVNRIPGSKKTPPE